MKDGIEQRLERFLGELDQANLGPYSALLHGSVARGQQVPGWSDINLVLVLDNLTTQTLERLRRPLADWRAGSETLPLMLTRAEWLRSADAYPLEITEMRTGYRVLRGADPLAGLNVAPADLRQALERELRGKLLRLRQGYALMGNDPARLSEFVRRSIASMLFLCRGLLVLAGRTPPGDPVDLANEAGRVAGFTGPDLARIVTHRGDGSWACSESDVRGYLAAVEQAARFVDHFQIGAEE